MFTKLSSSVLTLVLIASPVFAASSQQQIDGSARIESGSVLSINSYKGSISIKTWDKDEIAWDVQIVADGNEELVEKTKIRVERKGDDLVFSTDYEEAKKQKRGFLGISFGSNNVSLPFANYEITIPKHLQIEIDDYKSIIDIEGIQGDLLINNYKGAIDIRDGVSDIEINSYRAPIDIENLDGSLNVNTYKGEIHVSMSDIDENTSFDTYGGEVHLYLPKGDSFSVDAEMGRKSKFVCDFEDVKKTGKKNRYVGSVNGGGPSVTMATYKGSFEIYSN